MAAMVSCSQVVCMVDFGKDNAGDAAYVLRGKHTHRGCCGALK